MRRYAAWIYHSRKRSGSGLCLPVEPCSRVQTFAFKRHQPKGPTGSCAHCIESNTVDTAVEQRYRMAYSSSAGCWTDIYIISMLFPEFPSLIDSFMRTIRGNLNGLRVKLGRANEFFGAYRCERRGGFMCVDSSWSRNDKFLLPLSFTLARSFDLALRTRKRQRPRSSLFKYSLNVVSPPLRSTNDGDAGDLQIREPDALLRAPLSPARTNF